MKFLSLRQSADDGLKYFDQAVGSGAVAEKGKKVKVDGQDIVHLFYFSMMKPQS